MSGGGPMIGLGTLPLEPTWWILAAEPVAAVIAVAAVALGLAARARARHR